MAQYFILNQHSGELMGEYENIEIANEACSKLNPNLPYFSDEHYKVFDAKSYEAWLDTLEPVEPRIWSVYGVGRYADGLKHDELVMAETRSEARKVFEKRYPHLRAVDAYQVNK